MLTEKFITDKISLFFQRIARKFPLSFAPGNFNSDTTIRISPSVTRVSGNEFKSSIQRVFCCLLALGIMAGAIHAQSFQGGLRGTLKDKEGNVLPEGTLALTNLETNVIRTTKSNEVGEYVFEKIDPGKYKLSAYLNGFKKTERTDVLIETQQQITMDFALEVGTVVETVTITSDIAMIESATASTGTVLSKQILTDLPNSGRNPFMMSAITPNVIPVGNPTFNRQQDQSGSSAISLAGGPVRGNNYIIDGVPITDLVNRAVIVPSLEAVQEVKVQINTYDAEAGRTGGGFFNTTAKSGSNNYHGNIFGFLRPSSMHMQLRNQSFIVRVRFRERLTAKLAKIASPARWKTHYLFFQMAIAGESRSAFIGIRKRN